MAWRRGYLSLERLLDWTREHPLPNSGRLLPICVWGKAGAAKTQKVKGYCERNGLGIRIYQPAYDKSAADLVGQRDVDEATGKTVIRLPEWLPVEGKCEPEGILFIDEINRGGEDVLQGLFQPLGEGEIQHIGWKLPRGWIIVCAANPPDQEYGQVRELDQAMVRRMINYVPGWNAADWVHWGETEGKISQLLMDFAFAAGHLIDKGEGNILPVTVIPKANARTLEYLSALMEEDMPMEVLDVVATGLVGPDAADMIIRMYTQRKRGIRNLTGDEIFKGQSINGEETLQLMRYWTVQGRPELIRASTGRMVSKLYKMEIPPSPRAATENVWRWIMELPEEQLYSAVAVMEESIPDWLEYFAEYKNGELKARMPEDRHEIKEERDFRLREEQDRLESEEDAAMYRERMARKREQEQREHTTQREIEDDHTEIRSLGGFDDMPNPGQVPHPTQPSKPSSPEDDPFSGM